MRDRRIKLEGKTFGRLKVKSFVGRDKHGRILYLCECKCGKFTTVAYGDLTTKNTKSCGCWNKDLPPALKHGFTRVGKRKREYRAWAHAIDRCHNPNHPRFKDWGGRGIQFYEPWRKDFKVFLAYVLAIIGLCPPGKSIDRYPDNDGNYEPGNIRWATNREQQLNKRKKS